MLIPKLVTTLRGYTRAQLAADLSAGVIVGIVALPLAIAFVVIVYAIVQQHGVAGLAVATVMAGVILVGFGLAGNIDDALNRARTYLGLPPEPRPAFATPTVRREGST